MAEAASPSYTAEAVAQAIAVLLFGCSTTEGTDESPPWRLLLQFVPNHAPALARYMPRFGEVYLASGKDESDEAAFVRALAAVLGGADGAGCLAAAGEAYEAAWHLAEGDAAGTPAAAGGALADGAEAALEPDLADEGGGGAACAGAGSGAASPTRQ